MADTPKYLGLRLVAESLVARVEFLDAAGAVKDSLLAGVKRVRFGRYFDINYRVAVAIFPFDCLVACCG